MGTEAIDRAGYELLKAADLEATEAIANHVWFSERDRWAELAFCLIAASSRRPEAAIRELVIAMDTLGLLDLERLLEVSEDTDDALTKPYALRVLQLMSEIGLTKEESARALLALADAAQGFLSHFDGKQQQYLRRYGQLMLDEIGQWFTFRSLDESKVSLAFTYWLQNVLGMPLSLVDEDVVAFCREHDVTPADLAAAADQMDINLALVDDIAQVHMQIKRASATKEEANERVGD